MFPYYLDKNHSIRCIDQMIAGILSSIQKATIEEKSQAKALLYFDSSESVQQPYGGDIC